MTKLNRAFSCDVTAAILVVQNKETAAMLVQQAIPPGINSIFMQKSSFACVNQYGRRSRECKRSIKANNLLRSYMPTQAVGPLALKYYSTD